MAVVFSYSTPGRESAISRIASSISAREGAGSLVRRDLSYARDHHGMFAIGAGGYLQWSPSACSEFLTDLRLQVPVCAWHEKVDLNVLPGKAWNSLSCRQPEPDTGQKYDRSP